MLTAKVRKKIENIKSQASKEAMGVVQKYIESEPSFIEIGSALTDEIKKQLMDEARLEYAFTSFFGKFDAILAVQQGKMNEALARN